MLSSYILFSIGQKDIKKLLAYCSVENIGIIMIGMGLGVAGVSFDYPRIALFGFAGALLHVLNHALFKGLLFLGAGAIIRETGTGEIDKLGGLLKKMPLTGTLFLLGSLAISGLPLFNGFISELFIYAGAIIGAVSSEGAILPMVSALAILSLALTGGLAAAGFTKLFGTVFLGRGRTESLTEILPVPGMMKTGMIFLIPLIVLIGMASFLVLSFLERPILLLTGEAILPAFLQLKDITSTLSLILGFILGAMIICFFIYRLKVRGKAVVQSETWGCGISGGDASVQYTGSSFTAPITERFGSLLAARKELHADEKIFPQKSWHLKTRVEDWFLSGVFIKIIQVLDKGLALLRWFQCGKAGIYVLYIALTVLILIIWKFLI
ncbi:MAG: hypothetical protein JEY99_13955 [Spirochaetales bacterium]|nr:hypothetical protein [Spirochaetales bacterium]